ncbi:undecaprenyl-phosphate glucose phosphotransferase [Bradyrhizobium sp. CIAT3101]|uniref:undecaprenyl-phosphate glucose phosphotransferase n=1 Tax=Bradyrhizobium sp. CIAT3101 TaxID=439387 RepID=UPI0024B1815E|nr:undecaprenyl-phosphate glucose phosphotransferase [Bradyrhizobium sp. CIAT3101]WFU79148.1 undecaprenyl-phosphate glucose phosphotransferase [Bradyrhizobium sp. CIAT3101]
MADSSDIHGRIDRLGRGAFIGTSFRISESVIPYLLCMLDMAAILLSSAIAGAAYQVLVGHDTPNLLPYCAIGMLAGLLYVLRMSGRDYYSFPNAIEPRRKTGAIISCWCVTALLLALLAFLLKIGPSYSRGAFIVFSILAPLLLLAARSLSKAFLAAAASRKVVGWRPVVLIGSQSEVTSLREQRLLPQFDEGNIKIFLLSNTNISGTVHPDASVLISACEFARRYDCREILVALPWTDAAQLDLIRSHLKNLPIAARLLPDVNVRSLTQNAASERLRTMAVHIQSAPLNDTQCLIKRTADIILAALALLFFSPIMLITAVAIKLDSTGPIIFRQDRKGFNKRRFTILKFRTMTVQENGPTVAQATRNDPRVTELGRILRSMSVDELPQLFNVLRGDMSLVGPRPHALAHDDQFEQMLSDYSVRQHVKPGITGWAQCNGARGATPSVDHIAERVRLDLWYINNWSLKLDAKILVKTLSEVLKQRNAY